MHNYEVRLNPNYGYVLFKDKREVFCPFHPPVATQGLDGMGFIRLPCCTNCPQANLVTDKAAFDVSTNETVVIPTALKKINYVISCGPAEKKFEVMFVDSDKDFKALPLVSSDNHRWWVTQNFNESKFRNGDPIPEAKMDDEWYIAGIEEKPAWCYYDYDPANGAKYGKLYNWYAVSDPRGLGPKGWHIPSIQEWTVLTDNLGGAHEANEKMKSEQGWINDGNGTNSSGFSGLPGGVRHGDGKFYGIGMEGSWWSSTPHESDSSFANSLSLLSDFYSHMFYHSKSFGLSVRLLLDQKFF